MVKKVLLLGATDQHPERLAKLPKFLSVLIAAGYSVTLFSSACPREFRDLIEWVKLNSTKKHSQNIWGRLVTSIRDEVTLATLLVTLSSDSDRVVSLRRYTIPGLLARLIAKKPIRYHAGPSHKTNSSGFPNEVAERIANYAYAKIVVPSPGCVDQFSLERFRKKVSYGPFHVGDEFFQAISALGSRQKAVGYFGNLTRGSNGSRAVDSLLTAFSHLRKRDTSLSLILGGVGPLQEELREELPDGVTLTGWLTHDEVREWLDRIQLLVVPSIDEGLPTIVLQAMARGTPVLATPVGGNSDVLTDSETGFMMENTSPECIASNIQRALNHARLHEVAEKGRRSIEEYYSFRSVVRVWERILEN